MPIVSIKAARVELHHNRRAQLMAEVTAALAAIAPPEKIQVFFDPVEGPPSVTVLLVGDAERASATRRALAILPKSWQLTIQTYKPEWTGVRGALREAR